MLFLSQVDTLDFTTYVNKMIRRECLFLVYFVNWKCQTLSVTVYNNVSTQQYEQPGWIGWQLILTYSKCREQLSSILCGNLDNREILLWDGDNGGDFSLTMGSIATCFVPRAAWLLKVTACIDLTPLGEDDTLSSVHQLCFELICLDLVLFSFFFFLSVFVFFKIIIITINSYYLLYHWVNKV